MCGIFGYAKLTENELDSKDLRIITRFLTLENETRGRDSTGLAVVDKANQPFIVRKTKEGEAFLDTNIVREVINMNITKETAKIFGHTRMATHGAITVENAQPFVFKNILGTHNGVIRNHETLFKKHNLTPLTTCDSEIIFALLSTVPTLKERAKILDEMTGYFAIAFHDFAAPNALFFGRSNNPLELLISEDKSFVLWSSLPGPLNKLITMFSLKMRQIEIKDGYLVRVNPDGTFHEKQSVKPWGFQDNHSWWQENNKRYLHSNKLDYKPIATKPEWGGYVYKQKCEFCEKKKECRWHRTLQSYLCYKCLNKLDADPQKQNKLLEKKESEIAEETRLYLKDAEGAYGA